MGNILEELGDTFAAAKNNDLIKAGCAIVLHQNLFDEYLQAIGVQKSELKAVQFMGVPVIASASVGEDIVFLESRFPELGSEDGVDLISGVAQAFKARLTELKNLVSEALKSKGITFQNDTAFSEFARTQLIVETHGAEDVIFYEGEELLRYKSNFKPKFTKDDRNN